MSIWRSVHVKNNNKVEKFHDSEELAKTYLQEQIAEEHFAPILNGKGMSYALRIHKLVELIPEYYEKIAVIDDSIQEFIPHK